MNDTNTNENAIAMDEQQFEAKASVFFHENSFYFDPLFVEESINLILQLKEKRQLLDFFNFMCDLTEHAQKSFDNVSAKSSDDLAVQKLTKKSKVQNTSQNASQNASQVTEKPKFTIESKSQIFQNAENSHKQADSISCEANSFLSRLYNELGIAYMHMERTTEAKQSFEKANKYSPNNSNSLYNLGDLAFNLRDFETSLVYCTTILSKNPTHIGATYLSGLSHSCAGKPEEALVFFQKTTQLDPNSLGAHYWAGECLLHAQKYEEALPHFSKSHELSKQHDESARGLAICYLATDKPKNALEICEHLLSQNSANQIMALQIKGDAHIALDNIEEGAVHHRTLAMLELDARDFVLSRAHRIAKELSIEKAKLYAQVIMQEIPDMVDSFQFLITEKSIPKYEKS